MSRLPLFPLASVLLPHGRLPLRIFEPRYRDLVKRCIRDRSPFGVVLIQQGSEVQPPGDSRLPLLMAIGCEAHIVDWHALAHGLVGIVIEGGARFALHGCSAAADGLLVAEVSAVAAPALMLAADQRGLLASLWDDIHRHPELQRLGYAEAAADDAALFGSLAQVLPMPEADKYRLLAAFGTAAAALQLADWLRAQGLG